MWPAHAASRAASTATSLRRNLSVVFDRCGEPAEVLRLEERAPPPAPARGEVTLRYLARPINPSDLLFVKGKYGLAASLPGQVAGFEGVGIVEAVGEGVRIAPGARVGGGAGSWQEVENVRAEECAEAPEGVPDDVACQLAVNPVTAYLMLEELLGSTPATEPRFLLQSAATSAVGVCMAQLCRSRGVRAIGVVRAREDEAYVRSFGSDVICAADGPGAIAEGVKRITGGKARRRRAPRRAPPRGAADGRAWAGRDNGGGRGRGAIGSQVARALGGFGRMLCYGRMSGEAVQLDGALLVYRESSVSGFWRTARVGRMAPAERLDLLRRVGALVASGAMVPPVGPRTILTAPAP
eukprot:tig00021428_g21174.t1